MNHAQIEGASSAELRANYLDRVFRPVADEVMAADPRVGSLLLCIAQYWADEAEDAVHLELVPCVTTEPDWPTCLEGNPFVDEDGFLDWEVAEPLLWEPLARRPGLDANSSAIVAFASCCHELTSQEASLGEAFRPYAVARRTEVGGVEVEVVGVVLRPDWEDRFDLDDETRERLLDEAYRAAAASEQQPPPPPPAPGAVPLPPPGPEATGPR